MLFVLVLAAALLVPVPQPELPRKAAPALRAALTGRAVFLQAWRIARDNFYDPAMHGVDWEAVRDELVPKAEAAVGRAAVSGVINEALARLHASHTAHFTPDQREFYELIDVFYPEGPEEWHGLPAGPVEYVGVGLTSTVIDGRVFALDVYEGGPAALAGVLVGDELLTVEGEPWGDVAPFRERKGLGTTITVRREAGGEPLELIVQPRSIQPRQMFLRSMVAGAKVYKRGGRRIGYIRLRSYANPAYHEKLKDYLGEQFKDVDGLILDFRDGWGGATPQYMDIFNPVSPRMVDTGRDGRIVIESTWRKPTAVLINHGTRSGKEMLSQAIKEHGLATLVGTRTAGAVLGGTVFRLSDGSFVMMAIVDVEVDGVRLEGTGVEPDVAVERPIPYCAGADPQLQAALEHLARELGDQ